MVLKCLLAMDRDQAGMLSFSGSAIGKKLGLTQEEVESIFDQLVSKRYFTLLRAPRSSIPVRRVIDELNELDYQYVAGYVIPEHYVTRRNRLIEKLSDYGIEDRSTREFLISPKLAVEAHQKLQGYIDRLEKMSQLEAMEADARLVHRLLEEYDKGILEARKLLDLFRIRIVNASSDLDSRIEKTQTSLRELELRYRLGEMSEEEFRERQAMLSETVEELPLVRLALSSIMMHGEPLPEPRSELVEQLELVEARRVIGELDERIYRELRSKLMNEIKDSRRPQGDHWNRLSKGDLSLWETLLEKVDKLERSKLMSTKTCRRLKKAVKSDLTVVQKILVGSSLMKRQVKKVT
jgi:hypothetical protein